MNIPPKSIHPPSEHAAGMKKLPTTATKKNAATNRDDLGGVIATLREATRKVKTETMVDTKKVKSSRFHWSRKYQLISVNPAKPLPGNR